MVVVVCSTQPSVHSVGQVWAPHADGGIEEVGFPRCPSTTMLLLLLLLARCWEGDGPSGSRVCGVMAAVGGSHEGVAVDHGGMLVEGLDALGHRRTCKAYAVVAYNRTCMSGAHGLLRTLVGAYKVPFESAGSQVLAFG